MDSGTSCPASLSDATLLRESSEVGAVCVNAHVRICAGGGLRRSSLPRRRTESVWKHDIRFTLWSSMQPLNIQYFDVTVRVGCSLVYEVTGTASLLLNLKLCPDGYAVVSEALALGDNLHAEEFNDSHGNCIIRMKLERGTNCFRHDAIVSVSSQPD